MRCLGGKKNIMKHKIHLPILIEQDEDKIYIVSCPTFKGCHSYGNTIDEAMKNIEEVIVMCMEEEKLETNNEFIGFRELELEVA
jgi:predicted RNase H-like HicB family nuclease